jgi:5-methylcytosine-specific restriction endonuclease McrA
MNLIDKKCRRCSIGKPAAEFFKMAAANDGLHLWCKGCCKEYQNELLRRDPEHRIRSTKKHAAKIRMKRKMYRELNAGRIQSYNANYYSCNSEEMLARSAAWHLRNPHYSVEYYAKNVDLCKAKDHRRRARKKGIVGTTSKGLIQLLLSEQGGKCPYCLSNLYEVGHHLDHYMPLALDGRHADENLQLTCPTCNRKKGAKNPIDFLQTVMRAMDVPI